MGEQTLMVNVDVDDLERAVEFYVRGFGLTLHRRLFDGSVAELHGASSPLYLLHRAAGSPAADAVAQRRDYARHWTPVHVDFVVDDVEAATRRAVGAGARLEGEIQTFVWGRLATLADPFGHGVCLIQFLGRGYDEVASAGAA